MQICECLVYRWYAKPWKGRHPHRSEHRNKERPTDPALDASSTEITSYRFKANAGTGAQSCISLYSLPWVLRPCGDRLLPARLQQGHVKEVVAFLLRPLQSPSQRVFCWLLFVFLFLFAWKRIWQSEVQKLSGTVCWGKLEMVYFNIVYVSPIK